MGHLSHLAVEMKSILAPLVTPFLATASLELSTVLPLPRILKVMRRYNGMQLHPPELRAILNAVRTKGPCNFLVFGLGRDSRLWARANRGGYTVFLEDEDRWFHDILRRHRVRAHLVDYGTRRTQWKELLESPESLDMVLPEDIESRRWDVILVDGPSGHDDDDAGRMKSIFLASRLASRPADVFVHDCDRKVEQAYCDRYMKAENLEGKVGKLRHYHFPAIPAE